MRFSAILPILMSLMCTCQLMAQSVSIGTESIPVELYRLPESPLPADVATYSANVIMPGTDIAASGLNVQHILDNYAKISGYKRVVAQGDVHLQISIGAISITGEKMDSRKTTSLDREGNEHVKHEFFKVFSYAVPVSYKLTHKNGTVITDKAIADLNDKKVYKTDEYVSENDLDSYWRINKTLKLTELHKEMASKHLFLLQKDLEEQFGFVIVREDARFETIGKKKHPEFEKFDQALAEVRKAFGTMRPGSSIDEGMKTLSPAISFFEAAAQQYDAGDKEEAKLKHIALYNLAAIHYWTDNFVPAAQYVHQLLAMDASDKDVIALKTSIEKTQNTLTTAGKQDRRQSI